MTSRSSLELWWEELPPLERLLRALRRKPWGMEAGWQARLRAYATREWWLWPYEGTLIP